MTAGTSPVKLAGSLHSLNTCPSSVRRQAAEALGILAQEGSLMCRTGSSPDKSKPAAVPIVADSDAMDADTSVGKQQGSPIEENPTNDGGAKRLKLTFEKRNSEIVNAKKRREKKTMVR
jgi:hypothetical protein